HPLAHAIVTAAKEQGIALAPVRGFDSPPGKGAIGMVEGHRVALGHARFLAELGIATDAIGAEADALRRVGATVVYLALSGKAVAVMAVADPVRSSTPDALAARAAAGLRLVMLTRDNRATAEAVARSLGIDEVKAEVLPEEKSAVVAALRQEGRVV